MPRPFNCRRVGQMPACTYYKPQGVPLSILEQVNLTVDELESIRLVDLENLQQVQAAEKMNISRQTLGRILESAHKKIAEALVRGKALSIQGGPIELAQNVQPPRPHGRRRFRGGRGFGRKCTQ